MARTSRTTMNERKARVLDYLIDAGTGSGGAASVSYRTLSRAFGISHAQVRIALRQLQADGLVEAQSRHLPNGGQMENLYRVTARGVALRGDAFRAEGAVPCRA